MTFTREVATLYRTVEEPQVDTFNNYTAMHFSLRLQSFVKLTQKLQVF